MPGRRTTQADPIETRLAQIEAKLDEVARLLAVLVSRDRSLQETVTELAAVKFGPKRIAELIGTSSNYAKVAAGRARQRKRATGKKSKE
jgi:hypothetical protein